MLRKQAQMNDKNALEKENKNRDIIVSLAKSPMEYEARRGPTFCPQLLAHTLTPIVSTRDLRAKT